MTAAAGGEQVDRHGSGSGGSAPKTGGDTARSAWRGRRSVPAGPSWLGPGRPGAAPGPPHGPRAGYGGPPDHLSGSPAAPGRPPARPPVIDEPALLGFSRHLRSRIGTRLFTWFFVLIFVLILVQLIASLLDP